MKKATILFMVIFLIASIVDAKKKQLRMGVYWELSENGSLTISGFGHMPDFKFHKTKGSNSPWSKHRNNIKTVCIEDGVQIVGSYSFCNCEFIENVNFPNDVLLIGKNAFSGCKSLKRIELPSELRVIGESAFHSSGLENIIIPSKVKYIWDYAFANCKSLTSLVIPDSVEKIELGAFYNCKNLKLVSLPDGIESIGNSAFENCHSLISITIPGSVKKIASGAFKDCKNLKNVTILDGVESIGEGAFENCHSITSITIPGSVKKIASRAFEDCKNLKNVTMINGVKSIGEYAFRGCSSLDTIRVPKTVINMEDAFRESGTDKYYFDGYIKCLPSYVKYDAKYEDENYSIHFGLNQKSVKQYFDNIRNKDGDVVWDCPERTYSYRYNDGEFVYYSISSAREDNGKTIWDEGIMDENGKWIIPIIKGRKSIKRKHSDDNMIYYIVEDEEGEGVMDENGKWIIPIVKGRKSIERKHSDNNIYYYLVEDKEGKGVIDESGKWIVPSSLGCKFVFDYVYDNKLYFFAHKGSRKGIYDQNGLLIIPIEYEDVRVLGKGYYGFKNNGFWGMMNAQRKIIIPISRGYTDIWRYDENKKSFSFTMDGFKGELDINGRQISRIKVVEQKKGTPSETSDSGKTSLASTTGKTNTSKTSNKPGLLYKGIYNQNSQGYNIDTGQYTGFSGPDWENYIEIYEDSIVVDGTQYEYAGKSGQWKMYSWDRGGIWGKYVYFVDQNYNMKLHTIQPNPYMGGSDIFVYTMTKNGTQNAKYFGNQGGQVFNSSDGSSFNDNTSSNKSSSTSTRPICTVCHGGGKCHSCNGTGKRTDNQLGTGTNYSKTCGVCGGKKICLTCNGTGHR